MSSDIGTVITRVGGAPCECGCCDACGMERVRFFPRQILGADDLNTEQRYFKEKLRRHNRYLHGWGVVCGCEVRPAPTATKPYQVVICPGYVITPQGDEIMIGCPALFDLATCMVTSDDPCAFARPCPPITSSTPMRSLIYLGVCYKECEVRPVRVAPAGCSCDSAQCDYSRIRDAYEFACLDRLPASCVPPPYTCQQLCQGGILPCPPCPPDNCVVLATIRIELRQQPPPPPGSALQIDNVTDRRLLYSTAMLQMMALCQCGTGTGTAPVVAMPVITPETNTGTGDDVHVDITTSTPGASIYYTIDGTTPTTSSTLYTGAIDLAATLFDNNKQVTVKAIAVLAGSQDSPVATAVIHGNPNP